MPIGNVLDPAMMGFSVLMYLTYHLYFWYRYRTKPMSTTVGHNHEARMLWCEWVMREGRDILAVQTIRNTLMSSSLLASTSVTLSAVVAAYLVNTIEVSGSVDLDILAASYLRPIHKFFGAIMCFIVAFYCYMQSIRASNHVGYLVNLPLTGSRHFSPKYVANVAKRGADFNTVGTRIFYLAFLFVTWIFGPIPPFVLTSLLVPHLWYLDRADSSAIIANRADEAGRIDKTDRTEGTDETDSSATRANKTDPPVTVVDKADSSATRTNKTDSSATRTNKTYPSATISTSFL